MADTTYSIHVTFNADQVPQGVQQVTTAMQSIADEAKATTEKAKANLALLSEEFGVKIPGEIQSLVAQLPGVGEALKAAFSATVVIAIVQVLVDIAEKIETLSQQAEKHREAWVSIQGTMDETTQKTVSALDTQKAKYIEVTQGPLKAMEYELQHMQGIAQATFSSISSELQKTARQFSNEGGMWTPWQRANKEASADVKKMLADMQSDMLKAAKEDPKNLLAPFDKALEVTKGKITELTKKIDDIPKTPGLLGGMEVDQKALAALHQERAAVTAVVTQLETQRDVQKQIVETTAAQNKLANTKDIIAAGLQELNAKKEVEDQKRKLTVDTAHFELEQGKITVDQEEQIEKDALKSQLTATTNDLRAAEIATAGHFSNHQSKKSHYQLHPR